jgi:hypothetical protein
MQEWEKYFMKLLEGRTEKEKAETEMKKKRTAPEETEITVEEVRRLKKRRAPGGNKVKLEGELFKTTKGVKQSCPVTPWYLRYMWQI